MITNQKCLAQLLYLVSFYKRHNQTDVAIALLQDFIKQDSNRECNPDYQRVLALSLYNLAKLCNDEGDRLIAKKLYNQAVFLWQAVEPGNPLSILWYQGALQRLQEETDRLIVWGGRLERDERRQDIA